MTPRINPGLLLVMAALSVPLVVEARTMLVWIGVDLTLAQSIGVGALLLVAILVWGLWPTAEGNGTESEASG